MTLGAERTIPGLHPTRSARVVTSSGEGVGALGEVDPEVARAFVPGLANGRRIGWLEADLGLLLDSSVVSRRPDLVLPVSRYPSADVDLALVVDEETPAGRVAEAIEDSGGELLESVHLFDVYRGGSVGQGRKSLAFRLRFCALDRTLTDEEVAACRSRVLEGVAASVNAVLR
jgi:phenylalanyl-tRNA synthetase beta chain